MTRKSTSQAVRQMLSKGVPVKDICRKLHITPQTVYSVRYHMNKKRAAETGIKKLASKPTDEHAKVAEPALQDQGKPLGLVELTVTDRELYKTYDAPLLPKPTLWQRIKSFFGA